MIDDRSVDLSGPRKLSRRKLLLGLGAAGLAFVGLTVQFLLDQLKWIETPPYERRDATPARTLVVHYSRTGNTQGAAKEVARYFQADMLEIEAPQYGRTVGGQMLAARHADEQVTTTPIRHAPVDLSNYDLVVLCSPTWWFRPAVPLWSFVENHDFGGVPVFLLMTGNSRLKQEYIADFGALVEEKNGVFLDNLFIRRGRFFWQKTSKRVRTEVREALEVRNALWPEIAGHR